MQPALSSPKAHGPAQQLGTPSSQPWKAGSQERQLVTTSLGQGRSLFGQLLNTAVTDNLAKERNPSLFSLPKPVRAGWSVLTPAQRPLLPTPWLPTALGCLHSALPTTGCRALAHRPSSDGSCWMPQTQGAAEPLHLDSAGIHPW